MPGGGLQESSVTPIVAAPCRAPRRCVTAARSRATISTNRRASQCPSLRSSTWDLTSLRPCGSATSMAGNRKKRPQRWEFLAGRSSACWNRAGRNSLTPSSMGRHSASVTPSMCAYDHHRMPIVDGVDGATGKMMSLRKPRCRVAAQRSRRSWRARQAGSRSGHGMDIKAPLRLQS